MPGARVASGDRVTLRTVESEDVAFYQRAHANPELRYPLGWDVESRAELEAEVDDGFGHDHAFLVCLGAGDPDSEANSSAGSDPDGSGGNPSPDAGSGGMEDDENPRRIGCVVAGTAERARSGIGVWIVPECQGEGYGTEAASVLIDFLFRTYPHPAIRAKVLPGNDASRGLLESLGFEREGRARREAFWDGEYRDAILYGLLREDWEERD